MKLTHQESCWTGTIFFSLWHRQSGWLVFLFPLRPWLHTSWWIRATAISFPLLVFWTGFGWIRATAIFHYISMVNPSQSYYPGAAADPFKSGHNDGGCGNFLPRGWGGWALSMLQPKTAIRQIQYISDNLPYIDHHPHSPVSILLLPAAVIINATGDHHPHSPVTILLYTTCSSYYQPNRWPSSTQSGHYLNITRHYLISKGNCNWGAQPVTIIHTVRSLSYYYKQEKLKPTSHMSAWKLVHFCAPKYGREINWSILRMAFQK